MAQEKKRFKNEESVIKYVNRLTKSTEYDKGMVSTKEHDYVYLIEGWEAICIEDDVIEENGDWQNSEYLSDLVLDKHRKIFQTDFQQAYKNFVVLIDDLRDGSQFGVSVIVVRLNRE